MTSRACMLALAAAAMVQAAYYYPQLPDVMASHFDAAGQPNGWQTKAAFFALTGSVVTILVAAFLGTSWLVERLPVRLINR